ncbi:ABC transporter substrate-binding protein [Nisaea acidiphila]|uniref:ABC transporter substrate-binding protein n=1 Tax=Nisaea acidiphila TaxID=1862145 RepID=A0A9J7AP95_9PROT|nr:ABC transporter substrate-binding protein [Nisaea acidiphila]UUX49023.1 ABC transporter substrate-binding protein [Nisaea acidiphila]
MQRKISALSGLLGLAAALLTGGAVGVSAMEITDLKGRTVTLENPAERVLLGEGRFLIALGLLTEDPVARTAGMLGEFQRFDPDGYARFSAAFPALKDIPTYGQTTTESVSLETALSLQPDAAFFGLSGHGPNERSQVVIDALTEAGIPVLFIDFRDNPLEHTARSMEIIGQVLGLEAEAKEYNAFYRTEIARVTGPLKGFAGPKPSVFLDVRAGLGSGCCFTIARGMLSTLIDAAGGRNIAADVVPGAAGPLNLEYVIESNPDLYIGTAVGSLKRGATPGGPIVLGAGVDEETATKTLAGVTVRPGISSLPAVEAKRAYGIWHHFYNSPLNVYALQVFAKWLHPELFAELDPEATKAALLGRLKPADMDGVYAVSLSE